MAKIKVGFGQDSHQFLKRKTEKPCIVGGLKFDDAPGLCADSDGDVVFHAICNAITSVTHAPIMGKVAIDLVHNRGVTDSQIFLEKALETLGAFKIEHVALAVEGKRPRFQKRCEEMRKHIAQILKIDISQVGVTFMSGDNTLTPFGRGEALQCFCTLTLISCK